MAKPLIDFSTPLEDLLGGGDGFFPDGQYTIVKSRFAMFDFKQGPQNNSLCLMQELQPVEGGEVKVQHWPLNDKLKDGTITIEPVNPVKGEKGAWHSIRFTDANKYDKLYKKADFSIYLEHARKAEVDMDAVSNDITAFDGMTLEFGKFTVSDSNKTQTPKEKAEGGDAPNKKSYPKEVIVITGVVAKTKKKAQPKKKEEEEEEEDIKPKATKKKAKGPSSVLMDYIESVIVPEVKSAKAYDYTQAKLDTAKYFKKEKGMPQEEVAPIMAIFNNLDEDDSDGLIPLLDTVGLTVNEDKDIVKKED